MQYEQDKLHMVRKEVTLGSLPEERKERISRILWG